MKEAVSIIIPSYNRANCLHLALASVFAQSYHDIEVIVVDDASTDSTEELCSLFATKYGDRLRYIKNVANLGVSASRNIGIESSNGKLVAFLDSDDVYYPDKIEKQARAMEKSDAGFCCSFYATATDLFNAKDRSICWWNPAQPLYPNFLHPQNTWIVAPSVMVRRDVLNRSGGFEESMKTCEDLDLWSRILQETKGIILQEVLVCVYLHTKEKIRYFENVLARDMLYRRLFARDMTLDEKFKKLLYSALFDQYIHAARIRNESKDLIEKLDMLCALSAKPFDILAEELPLLLARFTEAGK